MGFRLCFFSTLVALTSIAISLYLLTDYNTTNQLDIKYTKYMSSNSKWLNQKEIEIEVNYSDISRNTYESYNTPYNVAYDRGSSCYIVFEEETKLSYKSITSSQKLNKENSLAHLHHHGPCGVCSNLHDFAVYASNNDLVSQVRSCSINILRDKRKCIEKIGFTPLCAAVWFWNTENTAAKCGSVCFKHLVLRTLPNVESGGFDYCKSCPNKLGGGPACARFQWAAGPMRINECLQCDECHSGPVFTRIAGGCRKAYGLRSSINRPKPPLKHDYFD